MLEWNNKGENREKPSKIRLQSGQTAASMPGFLLLRSETNVRADLFQAAETGR